MVIASLAFFAQAQAQDPVKGVLWETTAQASIPGMPAKMPAYTAKYCSKEEWTQPPATSGSRSKGNGSGRSRSNGENTSIHGHLSR